MRTSTIENFIKGNHPMFLSAPKQQNSTSDIELVTTRKDKPHFDIDRELANRTFIRPLPPKGHIVKNNIASAPLDFVQDIKTDLNALKSAVSGDANDHQLGKINDLGMKLGGLAIASYLFTLKHAPVTKAMEFVGVGSFFASMALWPKLALDIPARIIHGFSPFMRYEDAQGRKKRFFSDNQFIPFDMLSEKDINRIGNRLRVPKNLPNRREAIEEKMRQIALQNNTMWMLTAGFATPIMSSLICNILEPHVANAHSFFMNKKLDNIITDFNSSKTKYASNQILDKVNSIISQNHDQPINEKLIDRLSDALTTELNPVVRKGVKEDLKTMFLDNPKFTLSETQLKAINETINLQLKDAADGKLLADMLRNITPSKKQLDELFINQGYYSKPLDTIEIGDVIRDISKLVLDNINNEIADGKSIKNHMVKRLVSAVANPVKPINGPTLADTIQARPAKILDKQTQELLRKVATYMNTFSTEHKTLKAYAFGKLAQAPNTAKAKYWNDFVSSLVKTLGITQKEIEQTRYDRKLVGEIFNEKMWAFATAEPEAYKKFITSIASEIAKIDKYVKPDVLNGKYFELLQDSFNDAANKFRDIGFNATAERLIGNGTSERGTLIGATKSYVNNSLQNLRSTFVSIINKANVYRTLYKNPDFNFLENGKDIPREVKEEITAMIEYLTTEGRISDYAVKFDFLRNPDANMTDKDAISFEKGKISYKYYNPKNLEKNGIIIDSDINFFKRVMQTLFNTGIETDTKTILADYSGVSKMLEVYRKAMYDDVGNLENFMFPETVTGEIKRYGDGRINPETYTKTTPKYRANAVGAALDEMLSNTLRQTYNTRKWLKTFGTFGAGLLGFTVISQLFFGRSSGKYQTTNEKA